VVAAAIVGVLGIPGRDSARRHEQRHGGLMANILGSASSPKAKQVCRGVVTAMVAVSKHGRRAHSGEDGP
jgi:hypothetical protein